MGKTIGTDRSVFGVRYIRGRCLFCGLELVQDKASKTPVTEAQMAAVMGNVVTSIVPPQKGLAWAWVVNHSFYSAHWILKPPGYSSRRNLDHILPILETCGPDLLPFKSIRSVSPPGKKWTGLACNRIKPGPPGL